MAYKVRKAGQVAAFFAMAEGGAINILKLIKLIYISERTFLDRFDGLILDDSFVCMKHGPVVSGTLDYINGFRQDMDDWNEFICDRENHMVSLAKEINSADELDELSNAEIQVLEETWQEHGPKDQWELVDWTHLNCAEWSDPDKSSVPISYESILTALGKANPEMLGKRILSEAAFKIPA